MFGRAIMMKSSGRFERLKGIARESDTGRDLARGEHKGLSETDHYLFHCQNALYLIAEAVAVSAMPAVEPVIEEPEPRVTHAEAMQALLGLISADTDGSVRDWKIPINALLRRVEASQEAPGSTNSDG